MTKLPESVTRLYNFSWAPNHVSDYVTKTGHGLGLIASRDYGAFNIAWALRGGQTLIGGSKPLHLAAIQVFAEQECANKQVIQGANLGDWITLYNPGEFSRWLVSNGRFVEPAIRNRLRVAAMMAARAAQVPHGPVQ